MTGRRRARGQKSIFDPIHGSLTLSVAPLELIGDPAFQRLWGIRQTGLAHLVFPGANHTRLEHSLGVYWVARQMATALDLGVEDAELVGIGGLLHDLGHPPLSHTLDSPMLECLGRSHEGRSRDIVLGTDRGEGDARATPSRIPEILERHGLEPRAIADLIDPPSRREPNRTLRALLHGPIDADRIDYLQRDAHYTGVAHGAIDASRLLDTIQVRAGRLVFAEKGRTAVEGFVVGRSLMYSAVYYHKTVRSAEVMAQAAVERLSGYPSAARPLLSQTDADLLVALESAGGHSARIVRALRERRLYKRVHGWRHLSSESRATLRSLDRAPAARRSREDAVAQAIGARPGSVLLDLSGLSDGGPERSDWASVGILEDGRVTYPFRSAGLWREIALRPKNPWPAAVYVDPRYEAEASRYLRRRPDAWG
ncbi:MAG: HD domain-containing protein [Thermoplasmata archaeon]|nr:HD domain-containing protein [Thermoplasmata archaeon]MCI4358904.1 HD domain-containing protein [Thermoplasmata archaeon]